KTRWFYYFIIEYKNRLYIRKRSGKDIWENLYEFVLKENDSPIVFNNTEFLQKELQTVLGEGKAEIRQISKEYRQQLSHQTIVGQFITAKIYKSSLLLKGYKKVSRNELFKYPFPKFISTYLSEKLPLATLS